MEGGRIVYKDLSYEIVGVMFEVYNELGYGHLEKVYCKSIEAGFKEKGLVYNREVLFRFFS